MPPELRELANSWPQTAGVLLLVAFAWKYVVPSTSAVVSRAWQIHITIHSRLGNVEREVVELREKAKDLEGRLRQALSSDGEQAVSVAALTAEVRALNERFGDARRVLADDFAKLRDETRDTLRSLEASMKAANELMKNFEDHRNWRASTGETERWLRKILREEWHNREEQGDA